MMLEKLLEMENPCLKRNFVIMVHQKSMTAKRVAIDKLCSSSCSSACALRKAKGYKYTK